MDFTGYYWVFYWVSLLLFSAKDSVFIGRFLFRFSFVFLFVCFICLFFFAWRFFIGFLSRDGTVFFIRLVGRTPSSCRFFFPAVLLFVFFLLFFIIVFFCSPDGTSPSRCVIRESRARSGQRCVRLNSIFFFFNLAIFNFCFFFNF